MARITTQRAVKPWKCRRGCEIKTGEDYHRAKPAYRSAVIGCLQHPIKGFELSSAHSAQVEAAIDSAEGAVSGADSPTAIAEAVREVATAAEEVAQEYNDGADSQEEKFPSKAEESRDKASQLEDFKGTVESAADEIEGLQTEYDELETEQSTLEAAITALEEQVDDSDAELGDEGRRRTPSPIRSKTPPSEAGDDLATKRARQDVVNERLEEIMTEAHDKAEEAFGEYPL